MSIKILNLCIIEDSGKGKNRYIYYPLFNQNKFPCAPHFGYNYKTASFYYDQNIYELDVWDMPLIKRYINAYAPLYNRADCIIIFFSVHKVRSFPELAEWVDSLRNICRTSSYIIYVGNLSKLDSKNQTNVLDILIKDFKVVYLEASKKFVRNSESILRKVIELIKATDDSDFP
ncbi:hypothetical protein SteCoe_20267 [Stentor coeruleus]|uniref:Uncharacterized protein n=1 Tax=Stentor coeruleus TaxID=5963 RepID=A0A1R2BS66_9CILI|nr:hypothetical protein SteCoe_20267 [Stentor coeruleus]